MSKDSKFGLVVETADGSLSVKDPTIDEEYHSDGGALFEARALFIEASGYIGRLDRCFDTAILDVGLGLGYNALLSIEYWLAAEDPSHQTLVSLEKNSDLVAALASGDGPWMEGWSQDWLDLASKLEKKDANDDKVLWKATITHRNGKVLSWTVIVGDALDANLNDFSFDIVFQDAFSPQKNSRMWQSDWFQKVFDRAKEGCCLVTYSVARPVKDNLEQAGWQYQKIPAAGKKRSWLKAYKSSKS
ncbi:MAG: hypothetical protein HRU19_17180 [Pseudobacteriovorax sp.]|nr:hypothetical protein [Pseudobacteriovorax sp.]